MTPYDPILTQQRATRLLTDIIRPAIFTDHTPLEVAAYQCETPITYPIAIQQNYTPVQLGFVWGPIWTTAWFRLRGMIPESFKSGEFRMLFDTRTEALCWWDGVPFQGVELHRQDVKLPASVKAGGELEVYVEAACNHMMGVGGLYGDVLRQGEFPRTQSGTLTLAHVARYHDDRARLARELEVLIDLAKSLPAGEPRTRQVNVGLAEAMNTFRLDALDESLPATRKKIAEVLNTPTAGGVNTAHCIGNAHIDLAWMWPIRETKRKASRTFSTVLRYMERHSGYTFLQSQAQLYDWTKQNYPGLFEQIKARVKDGRWEAGGAAWVEPDCNIPSGESLVRQLLLGIRYFEREFGAKQTYLWQPDVFGYCAALPQILKLCGLDVFFSQKISWSQCNKFPHHTFTWIGIDGTGVVSHFLPADTYIGCNLPSELRHGDKNYQESAIAPAWLQAYGWGDGGGGPTEDQVGRIELLNDCNGVPHTRDGRVDTFAAELLKLKPSLPTWVGELYLELHRGTYTTQANTKNFNRECERLLQDAELQQSMQALSGKARSSDIASEMDRLWKLLLLNQFHDILPGSSIAWVYEDAMRDYAEIREGVSEMMSLANEGESLHVINSSCRSRSEIAVLPCHAKSVSIGVHAVEVQPTTTLAGEPQCIARLPELPPLSSKLITLSSATEAAQHHKLEVGELTLENEHVFIELDETGRVISFIDKETGREAIAPGGCANQFVLYEDLPGNFDAWDVDLGHLDKGKPIVGITRHSIIERGPYRAAIEFRQTIGLASEIVHRVQLADDACCVEVVVRVDWRESNQLLRVHHALDVHADHATHEIQFGHIRRTNHFNTSWDYGHFEAPAQRWMDLSEPGFGVTLTNDSKYGHSCLGNVMGLSLLRSTKSPDPQADMGVHEMKYALHLHGVFDAREAIHAAESLNQPLRFVRDGTASESLITLPVIEEKESGVVIDTIKPAEEVGDLIARLYESRGGRESITIALHPKIRSVQIVDLLERPMGEVSKVSGSYRLAIKPFQIVSLRLGL